MTETIDTANLRALAEAATPGPWISAGPSFGAPLPVCLNEVVVDRDGDDDEEQSVCVAPPGLDEFATQDMDYIAAANPAAIITLLDRLAAAEARNASLTDDAARYRFLRDAKSLELTSDGMEWTRADGTKFRASHRLCAGQTAFAAYPSLDKTIDAARAAASISTKGDDTKEGVDIPQG